MEGIKLCSININGIRNKFKRKAFFTLLRKRKYDIIAVHESFIITDDVNSEWEMEIPFKKKETFSLSFSVSVFLCLSICERLTVTEWWTLTGVAKWKAKNPSG